MNGGKLLANAMILNDAGEWVPITSADAGKQVQVIVNPSTGYKLKDDSLYLRYTSKDGSSVANDVIKADDHGRFYVTMPENAESVVIGATFEPKPDSGEGQQEDKEEKRD